MDDSNHSPTADHVVELLEQNDRKQAREDVTRMQDARAEDRKAMLQSLRMLAEEDPTLVGTVATELVPFLNDEERAIRLTTAKSFVAVAEADPDAVVPWIDEIATRLADEDEFYYVRARAAEALGYIALEYPDAVASPALLADLRIGLSFDEPEVKEKLAKALEYVAVGDPARLRHQVPGLADHLDDEQELVRYHLCTALVAIGCEHPATLVDVSEALAARLTDEEPYVRGRAAEALGLLGASGTDDVGIHPDDALDRDDGLEPDDEAESFVVDRVRFARSAFASGSRDETVPEEVGTVAGLRRTTSAAVEEMTAPELDGECPQCGLSLPADGPPMCPQCGAPY